MARITKSRSQKTGLPPGSLVHIGDKKSGAPLIELIIYNEDNYQESTLGTIDEAVKRFGATPSLWLNIDGIEQTEIVQSLGDYLKLHPLLQEDILNTEQRPKFEETEHCVMVIVKMLAWKNHQITMEQVSLVWGNSYLISFQEQPGDVFGPVRERLRNSKSRIRKAGPDYLAYSLIDTITDNYFFILEKLDEEMEKVEEELIASPTPKTLQKIHRLRRQALLVRKSVWPLREVISAWQRSDSELLCEETKVFIKDVYDHVVQVIDTVEILQELLAGMLDVYLSSLSNRMNEIMKVLTVISTIFIPLTFIVGIYGMNFRYMPELRWPAGYFTVLGLMALIAGLMVDYFKRKKWM